MRNETYIKQRHHKPRSLEEVRITRTGIQTGAATANAGGGAGGGTAAGQNGDFYSDLAAKVLSGENISEENAKELLHQVGGNAQMIHISSEDGMKLRTILATRVRNLIPHTHQAIRNIICFF